MSLLSCFQTQKGYAPFIANAVTFIWTLPFLLLPAYLIPKRPYCCLSSLKWVFLMFLPALLSLNVTSPSSGLSSLWRGQSHMHSVSPIFHQYTNPIVPRPSLPSPFLSLTFQVSKKAFHPPSLAVTILVSQEIEPVSEATYSIAPSCFCQVRKVL